MALSYVYSYDPVSKKYVGSSLEGFASPLEPGVILVPANATLKEPPVIKKGECLFWDEKTNDWIVCVEKEQYMDVDKLRRLRNELLRRSDFLMLEDYPLENKSEWVKYRQELRDLPSTFASDTLTWPIQPDVVKRK